MQSLLVGVDRSEACRRALRFALRRAQINDWRVCVVHVVYWSRYRLTSLEENERRPVTRRAEIQRAETEVLEPLLTWAEDEGLLEGVTVATRVRHGRPSEVLNDLAVQKGYDMIVVGRTGDSNLKEAIFGSTPNRLVQAAAVPVVVIP